MGGPREYDKVNILYITSISDMHKLLVLLENLEVTRYIICVSFGHFACHFELLNFK
jgi:hypothetical protein